MVAEQVVPVYENNNESIVQQQNELRAEQAKIAYVGDRVDLSVLKAEYEAGSDVWVRKIEWLEHKFSHFRRTRGDGNCFYRAFIFSYLEGLLLSQDTQETKRLAEVLQGWRSKLVEAGFQDLVFSDALDLLLEQLNSISQGFLSSEALQEAYQDDTASNLVIMLLRFIVSAEIKRRDDFFLPFILGMYDDPPACVDTFCQRYVEPMAEESDNIHIVALTDALQVPVTVVYLDRSGVESRASHLATRTELEVNEHTIVPDACAAAGAPIRVHVLYRPGHYDILYKRPEQG
ncbi:peptidase C65 Otubain-domain-containing protein [Haematococcus lacustris]